MGIKRDWRNAEDYEFTKGLSLERWAWEFLRRNEDYIQKWETLIAEELREDSITEDDILNPEFRLKLPLESKKWGLKYGFLNPYTDDPHYLSFDKTRAILKAKLLQKGKILPTYINKVITSDFGKDAKNVFYASTIFKQKRNIFPINFFYGENDVVAFFDLKLEIEPQINIIAKVLRKIQKKKKESEGLEIISTNLQSNELWTEYLRLLDAKKTAVSSKEIVKILFKNFTPKYPEYTESQKVRDKHDQALYWVKNYWKIVLH